MKIQRKNYKVIDTETGRVVGFYSSPKRAHNKADKLDLIYGGYKYRVVSVQ